MTKFGLTGNTAGIHSLLCHYTQVKGKEKTDSATTIWNYKSYNMSLNTFNLTGMLILFKTTTTTIHKHQSAQVTRFLKFQGLFSLCNVISLFLEPRKFTLIHLQVLQGLIWSEMALNWLVPLPVNKEIVGTCFHCLIFGHNLHLQACNLYKVNPHEIKYEGPRILR